MGEDCWPGAFLLFPPFPLFVLGKPTMSMQVQHLYPGFAEF